MIRYADYKIKNNQFVVLFNPVDSYLSVALYLKEQSIKFSEKSKLKRK